MMKRNEVASGDGQVRPRPVVALGFMLALLTTLTAMGITAKASAEPTVLRAAQVHVGNGDVLENGMLIVRDGRIDAIGVDLSVPRGANVIELTSGVVTPGLIDANAFIDPADLLAASREPREAAEHQPRGRFLAAMLKHEHDPENCAVCDTFAAQSRCAFAAVHDELEEGVNCPVCGYPTSLLEHLQMASGVRPGLVLSETSSEIVPHTHAIDSMNLRSPDFQRLMRGGVTTVFLGHDNATVIGPRGAIVRTAGPIRERVIDPSSAVTATTSSDAFRGSVFNSPPRRWGVTHQSRRPNTRMGLGWVFRKAFHDAQAYAEGRPFGGADTPSDEALPVLGQILDGEIPLRVHARTHNDITTAIRLTNEFGITFTLLEATEAYKCLDEIRTAEVPVVFGPIYVDPTGPRARSMETRESRLSTMKNLLDAGIVTALSAQDLREEDGLARQMMYAVRSGVDPAEALRAVTQIPARLLGLEERIGTLEAGKDAELVVWNAAPHEPGARPLLVMINGQVVFQD